jgi:hypothetical protein
MVKRHPLLFIGLMLVFFSLACQSVPFLAHPTPTPTVTPTPTNTPTPTKTNTPTGIPGITMPVTVNSVQIKFTDLHEASEINFGGKVYTPKSSSDTFVVARADVLTSGTSHQEVADWAVTMNEGISWALMQSFGSTNSITAVEWTFVVAKSTSSYHIYLPGGVDVELTSLLR